MRDFSEKRRHGRKLFFLPLIIIGLFAIGAVTMLLWNSVLTAAVGVNAITYWQALGLLLLSRILFGGGCWRGRRHSPHFRNLSNEEKNMFKAECCGKDENAKKE